MSDPVVSNPAESREFQALCRGAAQRTGLEALESSGVLGRWLACQSARMNYHAPYLANASTFWGGVMEVDIREAVSSLIFIHGVYEAELSAFFHRFLTPGQTFVDVGAHYGYFSLLAADRVGETGRVAAVEPCERTSWRLYHNIKKHKQVSMHRVAAWNKEDTLTFQDYGPLWCAFNSIGERRIHESAPAVKSTPFEVRAVALDDYFREINIVPDVIKIDAESTELQVLQGLEQTLGSCRPVVTIEVGDYSHLLARGVTSSAEILHHIASRDYVLYDTTLDGLTRHVIRDSHDYAYANIIAAPREKPLL